MGKRRTSIPDSLSACVLYKCARTCCVCRYQHGLQIHHIDGDPSNNAEENLVALCGVCHSEAHTTRDLVKNLTQEHIRHSKRSWEDEVENAAVRRLSIHSPGLLSQPIWMYFNVSQLLQAMRNYGLKVLDIPAMQQAHSWGLIDANGFPDFDRSEAEVRSLYERFGQPEAHAVHLALSDAVQRLVEVAGPVDLSEVWTKTLLAELPNQHPIVSIHRGMKFSSSVEEGHRVREVRYRKGGIELRFQLDPALIYSNSGYSFFSGSSQVAALLVLRSATPDKAAGVTVLKASPIALGVGFPREVDPRPGIAWRKYADEMSDEEAFE